MKILSDGVNRLYSIINQQKVFNFEINNLEDLANAIEHLIVTLSVLSIVMKENEERLYKNEKDFEGLCLKYNYLEKEYLLMKKGRDRERSSGRNFEIPTSKSKLHFQEKLRYM